ncbi:hypothetical protein ACSNOI_48410, partial [Actinomadura kijaniata]|uniref:hypothetical protein n=1 Tax=Actinomadura kijaniata TaxID=46161 RepID=UPI003F1D71EA
LLRESLPSGTRHRPYCGAFRDVPVAGSLGRTSALAGPGRLAMRAFVAVPGEFAVAGGGALPVFMVLAIQPA